MRKPKTPVRYFALHEAGLRNGSFYRISKYGIGQFINGDFMRMLDKLPEKYCGNPLVEFTKEAAEKLIPRCCL